MKIITLFYVQENRFDKTEFNDGFGEIIHRRLIQVHHDARREDIVPRLNADGLLPWNNYVKRRKNGYPPEPQESRYTNRGTLRSDIEYRIYGESMHAIIEALGKPHILSPADKSRIENRWREKREWKRNSKAFSGSYGGSILY